jgi:hypothetical protein
MAIPRNKEQNLKRLKNRLKKYDGSNQKMADKIKVKIKMVEGQKG